MEMALPHLNTFVFVFWGEEKRKKAIDRIQINLMISFSFQLIHVVCFALCAYLCKS